MISKITKKTNSFAVGILLAASNPLGKISAPGGIGDESDFLSNLISAIVRILIVAGFLVSFIMIIVGGIQYMTAGGDKQASASARGRVFAAIIGLVIVLASFAIIRLVEDFLGFKFLSQGTTIDPIR
ncbi:MAG TPA: hypothetical protein VIK81_04290 [Patescibacteria group bacterium]